MLRAAARERRGGAKLRHNNEWRRVKCAGKWPIVDQSLSVAMRKRFRNVTGWQIFSGEGGRSQDMPM